MIRKTAVVVAVKKTENIRGFEVGQRQNSLVHGENLHFARTGLVCHVFKLQAQCQLFAGVRFVGSLDFNLQPVLVLLYRQAQQAEAALARCTALQQGYSGKIVFPPDMLGDWYLE